jgi:hypothetical protein
MRQDSPLNKPYLITSKINNINQHYKQQPTVQTRYLTLPSISELLNKQASTYHPSDNHIALCLIPSYRKGNVLFTSLPLRNDSLYQEQCYKPQKQHASQRAWHCAIWLQGGHQYRKSPYCTCKTHENSFGYQEDPSNPAVPTILWVCPTETNGKGSSQYIL